MALRQPETERLIVPLPTSLIEGVEAPTKPKDPEEKSPVPAGVPEEERAEPSGGD